MAHQLVQKATSGISHLQENTCDNPQKVILGMDTLTRNTNNAEYFVSPFSSCPFLKSIFNI